MPNIVPTARYYPKLSEVITADDLPEFLSFVQNGLNSIFDKIHYKNLQYSKSVNGDAAFYSLEIVSKKLGIPLPFGMALVLNPDLTSSNNKISSFPITLEYQWEILAFLKTFSSSNFSFSLEDFYKIGLRVFRISEEQVIAHMLNLFVEPAANISEFKQLLADINELYGFTQTSQYGELNFPAGVKESVGNVANVINSHPGITKSIPLVLFSVYILKNNINDTKAKLQEFYNIVAPDGIESHLKRIITPKAKATLALSAGIEFPENILRPVTPQGVLIPDTKSVFVFAQAQLYADTEAGIGFELELGGSLYPQPGFAEIGKTGLLLQIESLKIDLSKKTNIIEADLDGRPNDFIGVYARALSVTLPSKWFHDDTEPLTNSAATLRIGAYDLLVGTGGVSGTILLETVPVVTAGNESSLNYFNDKFNLNYPITMFQKNPLNNVVIEKIINNYAELKAHLQVLNTTGSPYVFKFPISLTTITTATKPAKNYVFNTAQEYQLFLSTLIDNILWKKLGSSSGFRIGFNKFDITFKQNKVIASNIRAALEVKKFVYPQGTLDANNNNIGGEIVRINVEGHLHDNGDFNLTASTNPPYPIRLPDVFTYHIKTLELGKENNDNNSLFYIGTSGTLQFEGFLKTTMGLGPLEIERLRIYSDGSIDLKGGGINLIKPIVLKLGPVDITVTAIHFGSHQKEVNGVMRKFNYFGFDGGISVDPLGIEIRGDGVKFYYCSDDLPNKPQPYVHIKTIYLDLTLPASTPVAIVNGYLSIPEPGVSQEYTGGLKLQLPKLKITGSVGMKLMPKYPAFIIDAAVDFPKPIPLGPVGIYGFNGLFGYRYVAEMSAVAGSKTWYEYYKAPRRGINIHKFNGPEQTKLSGTPISIGAGASLGTTADNGTVLNIKAMVLLSIPSLLIFDGRAAILSARLGLEDTQDPPFFAFIMVSDDSLELGFGADFKMPTRTGSMLTIYADVQAGFFFKNQKPWYVNIGTKTNPVSSRVLNLLTLKSYVMLSAKGIEAGGRGEFNFQRRYGIIRVRAWAYIEVGGKISFERPQFGAYIKAGVGADINIKFVSLYLAVDIMFGAEASKPFKIYGSFHYRVRIRFFIFKFNFSGNLSVVWEINNQVDRSPINPMINTSNLSVLEIKKKLEDLVIGVNMLSNEKFQLAYLANGVPAENAFPNEILEKIIPIDTYIDIKTEKGLQPGNNTATDTVRKLLGGINNPAERYTDLIPPDEYVKGKKMRQVKHRYSLEKIEIRFWNGTAWRNYHPYKAMFPDDTLLDNLKIGQFQKSDGQYNMVRLLATTPFSYTEQGQAGWYVPEQYGITAGALFCEGQQLEKKCADFELKPLLQKYYCSNPNHLLFSNDVAFQLLDSSQTAYAEVTNETHFSDFTQSLKFDNQNKMQIVFPNAALQIGLKVSNFAHGVRVKYYATIANEATDLLPNPVFGNPDPNAENQNEPFVIEKNVEALNVPIEYNKPDWKGVSKVVIEPIFDAATAFQIDLLTEQIASITENNNLISLELIEGELVDTTPLENHLQMLLCSGGNLDAYTTFINSYNPDDADPLRYKHSEEFMEWGTSQIYAIGQSNGQKGLITKLAANGDVVWEKNYIIPHTNTLTFHKIIQLKPSQTSNGYLYVVYGIGNGTHYLLGINELGSLIWTEVFYWYANNLNIQIIASLIDTNFYVSISELNGAYNKPQIARFDAAGNFINGRSFTSLSTDQKIVSLEMDSNKIVLGISPHNELSHGIIYKLDENLNALSGFIIDGNERFIHDVKILGSDSYLVSGYLPIENVIYIAKIQENVLTDMYLLPNTEGKTSQLQLCADGFYMSVFDLDNGVLHRFNHDFVLNWSKEIKFYAPITNRFASFRYNQETERLTFNLFNLEGIGGSAFVGHTNKDFESCFTTVLVSPVLNNDKKISISAKFFNYDEFRPPIKVVPSQSFSVISSKLELCPTNVNSCGTEDEDICIIHQEILILYSNYFVNPNLPENAETDIYPIDVYANDILSLIVSFNDVNPNYDLYNTLINYVVTIQQFVLESSNLPGQTIAESSTYYGAWLAVTNIIDYLDDLGNCTCTCESNGYTLLHEVCWMTEEDYEYNTNIPSQSAIAADAAATVAGINNYIQPVWRPDTSYYVHFELKDTVANANAGIYKFAYGFTTAGPVGYFHTHPKATYGDIPLKAGQYLDTDLGPLLLPNEINGKVLEDTVGIIRNPDGSVFELPSGNAANPIAKINPHPDKYPLTSLGQYIDYERSYPNANGNLLGAKPLFYNDTTTQINLFFNKAYTKNFFREWPTYDGKTAQTGRLKIVIKDPVEASSPDIINPPALDYDKDITTIPQTTEEWNSDDNPQIPFVLSQYGAMLNAPNCVGNATIIKPKSEYITIIPKNLKPNKLYTAIVNNMYTTLPAFASDQVTLMQQTKEVHRFVFKTSRYETFKQQVESFFMQQTIEGSLVQKQAIFTIEKEFSVDQIKGVYNTIIGQPVTGFSPDVLDNFENNYQHPFDRVFEGILELQPLDEPISTEVNIIRNKADNKVIAIIVRNPEPFNNPKMPLNVINQTLIVLNDGVQNPDYKVLFSKDNSQAIIMNVNQNITEKNLQLKFAYKIYQDNVVVINPLDYYATKHEVVLNVNVLNN